MSHQTVAALLDDLGYSLQANRKTKEGQDHADRDAQFEYISRQVRAFQEDDQPAISVDAKKKENIETVASFLEFFRPRTGLMQGLRSLCAIGRLLIPLHVQGDTLANVFSRPH